MNAQRFGEKKTIRRTKGRQRESERYGRQATESITSINKYNRKHFVLFDSPHPRILVLSCSFHSSFCIYMYVQSMQAVHIHVPSDWNVRIVWQHMAFDEKKKTIKSVYCVRSILNRMRLIKKKQQQQCRNTLVGSSGHAWMAKEINYLFFIVSVTHFVHVLLLLLSLSVLLTPMLLLLNRQWAKRTVETKATNAWAYCVFGETDKDSNNNGATEKVYEQQQIELSETKKKGETNSPKETHEWNEPKKERTRDSRVVYLFWN